MFSTNSSAPTVMSSWCREKTNRKRIAVIQPEDTEVSTMRQIPLSQNKIAILDDDDFDRFSQYHWCYRGERNGGEGYAIRHAKDGKKKRTEYLHRAIMNPAPGLEVIFLNYDRLDCRRENLRIVSKQEARRHHRVRRDSDSGMKGVRFNPDGGSWSALTFRDGHCRSIGTFSNKGEASWAYEQEMKRENPDFAKPPERVERRVEPVVDAQQPEAGQPVGQA